MLITISGRYKDTPWYRPTISIATALGSNADKVLVITAARDDANGDDSWDPSIPEAFNSLTEFNPTKLFRIDAKAPFQLEIGDPPTGGVLPASITHTYTFSLSQSKPNKLVEADFTTNSTAETGRFSFGVPVIVGGDGTVTVTARLRGTDGTYSGSFLSLADFNAAVNNLSGVVAADPITYQLNFVLTSGASAQVRVPITPQMAA